MTTVGELVAQFLRGAGTVLDLFPAEPPPLEIPTTLRTTDAQRIGGDWRRVGKHIEQAMKKTAQQSGVKLKLHGPTK